MDMERISRYVFALATMLVGLPLIANFEVEIDPEYINGILTASSIILGFWAILIEKPPKKKRFGIFQVFIVCILMLIGSIMVVYISGFGLLPSSVAFWICIESLLYNSYTLGVGVYYLKFKG